MRTQAISPPDADNRISNGFFDDHDSTGPGDGDRSLALHNDDHDETPEEEEAEEVHEERWKEGRGTFLTCFLRGDIPYKWRVRNITKTDTQNLVLVIYIYSMTKKNISELHFMVKSFCTTLYTLTHVKSQP